MKNFFSLAHLKLLSIRDLRHSPYNSWRRPVALALGASALLSGCKPEKVPTTSAELRHPSRNPATVCAVTGADQSPAFRNLLQSVVRLDVWATTFDEGTRQTRHSIGSGVIMTPEGHILTNAHVATVHTERIEVTLPSLERVKGKFIGWDHWTDLAVVQLDMETVKQKKLNFAHAGFGKSGDLYAGIPVFAVGTPYGMARTLTHGIISCPNRYEDPQAMQDMGYEKGNFNTWLQTDAAINFGNSGGPLVTPDGQVVGINTWVFVGRNQNAQNLGFAVPSDIAARVMQSIIREGFVTRSYIGIQPGALQDLDDFCQDDFSRGMLIRSVDPGSPADAAGLLPGDIVLKMEGEDLDGRFPEQVPPILDKIACKPVGTPLKFQVRRNEKLMELEVKTEKLESRVGEKEVLEKWGLSIQKVTRTNAREEKLPSEDGARVIGVHTSFPGDRAGVMAGDIIVSVNQEPVKTLDQLRQAHAAWSKEPGKVLLEVMRQRQLMLLVLKP